MRFICALVILLAIAGHVQGQSVEPSLAYHVPSPVSLHDLQCVKQALVLSDQQAIILDALHAKYAEQWEHLESELLPPVQKLAMDGAMVLRGRFDHDAVAAFRAMDDARMEFVDQSSDLDVVLWRELEQILSEEQIGWLTRVKQQRLRDRCGPYNRDIQGSRVDLVSLLRKFDIVPAASSNLDMIMREYDAAVTPPFVEMEEYSMKAEAEALQLAADVLFAPMPPGLEYGRLPPAYDEGIRRVMRKAMRLQKRIVTINQVFLPRILEELPTDISRAFHLAWKMQAYPTIYPDPTDPIMLFDAIKEQPLPADTLELVNALWFAYRTQYDSICRQLQKTQDDMWEARALTRASPNISSFRETMFQYLRLRFDRNESIADQMLAVVPDDLRGRIAPLVQTYHRDAAPHRISNLVK